MGVSTQPLPFEKRRTISKEDTTRLSECTVQVSDVPTLEEALQLLVELSIRTLRCHVVFLYLYDKRKEKLVLTNISTPYYGHKDNLEIALGEGLVGRVALNHCPITLKSAPTHDPHFLNIPGQYSKHIQSTIIVPLINKSLHLVGVMCFHTCSHSAFTTEDQNLIISIAALAASTIEHAHQDECIQQQQRMLTTFTAISQILSSTSPLEELLPSLAKLTCQLLSSDICLLLLANETRDQLIVEASSPFLDRHALQAHAIALPTPHIGLYNQLNLLRDADYKAFLPCPIQLGNELLGYMCCYRDRMHSYTSEEHLLLSNVASQAALTIKNRQLLTNPTQKNYLRQIAELNSECERYVEKFALLAHYDEHKGTDLLHTLETFLVCSGNFAEASHALDIHRNTLLQRLERMNAICDLDFQSCPDRFTLQLALKLYRLQCA